jgi:hypothetical protein
MNNRNWLCMDCGKNTFDNPADYYMLRNRLWRTLVPRSQRHGMLCLACVELRLGRSLLPNDFRNSRDDEADPTDGPMTRADYGIIDSLSIETLHVIDAALLFSVTLSPRSVRALVVSVMESSAAVPGLPDWFYIERIEHLLNGGDLIIIEEHEALLQCKVRSAKQ